MPRNAGRDTSCIGRGRYHAVRRVGPCNTVPWRGLGRPHEQARQGQCGGVPCASGVALARPNQAFCLPLPCASATLRQSPLPLPSAPFPPAPLKTPTMPLWCLRVTPPTDPHQHTSTATLPPSPVPLSMATTPPWCPQSLRSTAHCGCVSL